MSQQKWGWVFGFCRPEIFLFKCYVFGFVEAVLVFPRNVPTKSEAPTPSGQFLGVCFSEASESFLYWQVTPDAFLSVSAAVLALFFTRSRCIDMGMAMVQQSQKRRQELPGWPGCFGWETSQESSRQLREVCDFSFWFSEIIEPQLLFRGECLQLQAQGLSTNVLYDKSSLAWEAYASCYTVPLTLWSVGGCDPWLQPTRQEDV